MSRFWLYRWRVGGRWARLDTGEWAEASKDGWLRFEHSSCHWTYNGITKREYHRIKEPT